MASSREEPRSQVARVTMADVAQVAGVSEGTVSKVLSKRHPVSGDVRDRVESVAKALGYKRRSPRAAGSADTLIQVVVKSLKSPFLLGILDGVQASAVDVGASVIVTNTSVGDPLTWRRIHRDYPAALIGSIIVSPDKLIHESVRAVLDHRPSVIVEPRLAPIEGIPTVSTANWSGGMSAMEHLIGLGHERIGMIGGGANSLFSMARYGAYIAALNAAGLSTDPALRLQGDFTVASGERLGRQLLELRDPPTAVFAGNDEQALGLIRIAREWGVRVPNDLSVVGFDDVPESVWTYPTLTTVRQPADVISQFAVRLLLEARDAAIPPRSVEVATDLVIRQSTGPPGRGNKTGVG